MPESKQINILFIGPSGSGKGTQAELIAKKYGLQRFQSGAILRKWAKEDSEFGRKVRKAMNEGFVPSEWIFKMTEEEFRKADKNRGLMLENFSRMLPEIKNLYKVMAMLGRELDYIFLINISDEEAIRRLTKRGTCSNCEKVVIFEENLEKAVCPNCGNVIIRREDDNVESIKKRLNDYHNKTSEVIDYIKENDKLIMINGGQSVEKVYEDIVSHIENNN